MTLSNIDIEKLQKETDLINPFNKENVQPNSYDLTLSNEFLQQDLSIQPIDLSDRNSQKHTKIIANEFILRPHTLVLATTKECVNLPNTISGQLEGRSSIGRNGLFIHNAGVIDSGFIGEITLELFNASDNSIVLKAGTRIAQLIFNELKTPTNRPYNGKYQKQKGATASKIYEDFAE